MIIPNPKAHLHPKDLHRQLVLEAQTIPGWSLNDKAFHASLNANRDFFALNTQIHQAIKAYYLGQGYTLEQWQTVSSNLKKFNQVWRQSLCLPLDDVPPPLGFRLRIPGIVNPDLPLHPFFNQSN
jgi:hypothetical protein